MVRRFPLDPPNFETSTGTKYDPISHHEYYSFFALFNQTEDADLYTDAPTMELLAPREKAERKQLQANIEKLSAALTAQENAADKANEAEEKKMAHRCRTGNNF